MLATAALGIAAGDSPAAGLSAPELAERARSAVGSETLSEHLAFLDKGLLDTVRSQPKWGRPADVLGRAVSDPATALAIGQAAAIRQLGTSRLAGRKSDVPPDFAAWLLGTPAPLESFLESVDPHDNVPEALRIWSDLWTEDTDGRERYWNLAMACALVFDLPAGSRYDTTVPVVDVAERYRFYREAAEKRRLKVDLPGMPVDELVWVVDARVPSSELAWAIDHVNLSRRGWSKAYGMVKYRMDKATQGEKIHDEYTLKEIRREGGTCGDQAYFATISAKANGVPATTLAGTGQRGGHAWFGYKATSKEWNLSTGRYEGDRYAAGTTIDPQSGQRIKEQTLLFMSDPQRRAPDYRRASRLVWLAEVCATNGETELAGRVLEAAVTTTSRHPDAWTRYFDWLGRTGAPAATWDSALQRARTAFKNYPDMLDRLNALSTQRLPDDVGSDDIMRSLRAQTRKLESRSAERTDLIVGTIDRHVALLLRADAPDAVADVYERSLKEFGEDVAVFTALSRDYFTFASKTDRRSDAVRKIDYLFKRQHGSVQKDYFAIQTQAGLMEMVAGFYEADGNASKAKYLRHKAERLRSTSKAAHRFD